MSFRNGFNFFSNKEKSDNINNNSTSKPPTPKKPIVTANTYSSPVHKNPESSVKSIVSTNKSYQPIKKDETSKKSFQITNIVKHVQQQIHQPKQYNVLIIGATGSGKSTFVNMCSNYFLDGKLHDLKIVIPTEHHVQNSMLDIKHSENVKDKTQSQTSTCSVYKFSKNGDTYSIIDTPGFLDNRGEVQKERNITDILETVLKHSVISGVILVINGTEERLSNGVKEVINCLRGNLPNDLFNNTMVVFTFCSYSFRFPIDSLEIPNIKKEGRNFRMENFAFGIPKIDLPDPNEKNRLYLKMLNDWEESCDIVGEICESIKSFPVCSTQSYAAIKKARETFTEGIHVIGNYIIQNLELVNQLAMDEYSMEKTAKKKITRLEHVPSPTLNLICSTCDKVCAMECTFKYNILCSNIGLFSGKCKKCSCYADEHYHSKKIIVPKERSIQELLDEVKNNVGSVDKAKRNTIAIDDIKNLDLNQNSIAQKKYVINDINILIDEKVQHLIYTIHDVKSVCTFYDLDEIDSNLIKYVENKKKYIIEKKISQEFYEQIKILKEKISKAKQNYPKTTIPLHS
eukprot:gene2086-2573_t